MKLILKLAVAAALAATTATAAGAQAAPQKMPAPACTIGTGVTMTVAGLDAADKVDHVSISYMKPLTITAIRAGSPASNVQLHVGDKVVGIDGKTVYGMTLPQAIAALDGAPFNYANANTDVTITIRRSGNHIGRTITLKRSSICP